MWMGLVAIKVWILPLSASRTASAAAWMSSFLVRARPAMTGPFTVPAMSFTASKSPGEAAGKPASMTSTFIFASWRAIRSFSSLFRLIPAACSPSLRVVSNIRTLWFSVMSVSPFILSPISGDKKRAGTSLREVPARECRSAAYQAAGVPGGNRQPRRRHREEDTVKRH